MNELVSVIMPVYNGAKYVKKGIESVIAQTYKNIELIIIDDGSRDESADIIKDISKTDSRIHYYYQNNSGIGNSRNRGISLAIGEYIAFIDQDDWYENEAIEEMLNKAVLDDSDEVIGSYRLIDVAGKIKAEWQLNPNLSWTKYRIVAPWGRLYKKSVIDKHNIRFLDSKISEDLFFNLSFMAYTDKISIINKVTYNWLYNTKSESRTNWNKLSDDRNPLVVLNKLQQVFFDAKNNGYNYLKENDLTYFHAKYLVWYMFYNRIGNNPKEYRNMKQKCFEWLQNNYPHYTERKYTGISVPKGEIFKNRLCVTGCIFLHKIGLF